MTSKRIGLSLLDTELLGIINASAKIFPMSQEEIDNDINPNNYEYGRVGNHIYRWSNGVWSYIIADDVDIPWSEIKNKPTTYPPAPHTHGELHTHSNYDTLESITTQDLTNWRSVIDKADLGYVNQELVKKSNITHNHDEAYAVKSIEVSVLDHETRLYNMEHGYSAGHFHNNLTLLEALTQEQITTWDSVTEKASTDYVNNALSSKVNTNTFTGHTGNASIHVTQEQVSTWDNKADKSQVLTDVPVNAKFTDTTYSEITTAEIDAGTSSTGRAITGRRMKYLLDQYKPITTGPTKPTDGSMWFQTI